MFTVNAALVLSYIINTKHNSFSVFSPVISTTLPPVKDELDNTGPSYQTAHIPPLTAPVVTSGIVPLVHGVDGLLIKVPIALVKSVAPLSFALVTSRPTAAEKFCNVLFICVIKSEKLVIAILFYFAAS
jgi:hypothetical protein